MINSAVRRSLIKSNERRRSSSGPVSFSTRQVERICDGESSEIDDGDNNDSGACSSNEADTPPPKKSALSASLGLSSHSSRIHPDPSGSSTTDNSKDASRSRRMSSMRQRASSIRFPIRYTIAQKLKAGEESSQDVPDEASGSAPDPDGLPLHAQTSNHWQIPEGDKGGQELKGSFYVPNETPWFILMPHNKYRTSWDIFMAWLLSVLAFYVPFRVCFYFDEAQTADRHAIFWIELGADALFAIDIILIFLTAYGDSKTKRMVVDPRKIAKRYLTGFFFVDIIATFPFGLILSHPSIGLTNKVGKFGRLPKLLKFLRAAKLLKLVRLQQFISRLETEYNIHQGITRMIKVISLVFLVTHVVGCVFYLIGLSGGMDPDEGGWIYRFDYHEKTVPARYIASMYWAFSTLTTVGYGDISARTPQEQAFSMAMMLVGVSWYAYVVSSMSTIMSSFDAQNKAVRDKMLSVNSFIRTAKLPSALARRVRGYFEFRLNSSQRTFLMNNHYDADELLEELGSTLRTDILLHLERNLVKKIPFFEGKVPQFVADTISMLQPMVFQVGDTIVREGSQADEMYFLVRGRAAVLYGENEALTIEAGSYFGEIGCIMGGIRRASIKAVTVVELQALSRRNLNILLVEYPEVAEELKGVAKHRAKIAKGSTATPTTAPDPKNTSEAIMDVPAPAPAAVPVADTSQLSKELPVATSSSSSTCTPTGPDQHDAQQLASLVGAIPQLKAAAPHTPADNA